MNRYNRYDWQLRNNPEYRLPIDYRNQSIINPSITYRLPIDWSRLSILSIGKAWHNKLPLTTDGILEVKVITKPVDYSNQLLLRWNFQNKTFYETHGLPRNLSSIHI